MVADKTFEKRRKIREATPWTLGLRDIFSPNINKISNIAKVFQKCFETRAEILAQQLE